MHGGFLARAQDARHRLIGGQHAFLDELVTGGVNDRFDAGGAAVVVETDADFRHFQIQCAVFEAALAQDAGQPPAFADGFSQRGVGPRRRGLAVKDGLGLLVGELGTAVNDRIEKAGFFDFAIRRNF